MQKLLQAILDDDRVAVKTLLKADPTLVSQKVGAAKLYESPILHWHYVGDTALHLAAAGARVEIVRLLVAADADPNAAANHRRSGPLHYAADGNGAASAREAKQQVSTIRALLDAGAAINAADKNGAAPLHRAVRHRCAAAVVALLEAGADPRQRNKPGSTPFHLAVQNTGASGSGTEEAYAAQREIIGAFLAASVPTTLKDGRGKTVAECARSAVVRELLKDSPESRPRGV